MRWNSRINSLAQIHIKYTIKVPSGTVVVTLRFVTNNLFSIKQTPSYPLYIIVRYGL